MFGWVIIGSLVGFLMAGIAIMRKDHLDLNPHFSDENYKYDLPAYKFYNTMEKIGWLILAISVVVGLFLSQ